METLIHHANAYSVSAPFISNLSQEPQHINAAPLNQDLYAGKSFSPLSCFKEETREQHSASSSTFFIQPDGPIITYPYLAQRNRHTPVKDFIVQEPSPVLLTTESSSTRSSKPAKLSEDVLVSPEAAKPFQAPHVHNTYNTMELSPSVSSVTTPTSVFPDKIELSKSNLSPSPTAAAVTSTAVDLSEHSSALQNAHPGKPPVPCPSNSSDTAATLPAITDTTGVQTPEQKGTASPLQRVQSHVSQHHQHESKCPSDCPSQRQVDQPTLWVFGYGSLMWKTDFAYRSKRIGFIEGYERRFYLGNTTFRGRPGQPGRVANLVEVENGKTWGVAFEVHGHEEVAKVLKNLHAREVVSGGYLVMTTSFFPRESHTRTTTVPARKACNLPSFRYNEGALPVQNQQPTPNIQGLNSEDGLRGNLKETSICENVKPIQAILFTVTEESDLYLGPDDVDSMARQVVGAKGSAGTNVEYVTKTADYVRMHIPEDEDDHLFQLDAKVRELVYKAQAHDIERVRLGLSDNAHNLHETQHNCLQSTAVNAS